MTVQAPTAVLVLWWIALGLTVLVIVPLAVTLLARAYRAARSIRHFTAETLQAARGVVDHTAAIPALEDTVAAAGPLLEKTGRLRDGAAILERTLRERAG